MVVHDCNVFMQDGALCQTSKPDKNVLQKKNNSVRDWPGHNPELNPIEHLWQVMKNEVSDQHATTMISLNIAKNIR